MKWQLIILLLLIVPTISAFKIEQKIDIINAGAGTTSTTFTPLTGRTGIVEINLSKYDHVVEIYYETTGYYTYSGIPNGFGCGNSGLYDLTNAAQIDEATIALGGSPALGRSGNLTYIFDNSSIKVTPNIKAPCALSTTFISGARLVIVQDGDINKTRTYIPIGQGRNSLLVRPFGGPYNEIEYPKRWNWTDDDFGGTVTTTFASTAWSSIAGKKIFSTMLDYTGSTDVVVFSISSTSPTWNSSTVSLTDGQEYSSGLTRSLAFPASPTATQRNAFIIVDQEGIQEDLNITLVYQMENTFRNEVTGSAATDDTQQVQYNASNIDGVSIEDYFYDFTARQTASGGIKLLLANMYHFTSVVVVGTTNSTTFVKTEVGASGFVTYEDTSARLRTGIYNLDAAQEVQITSARFIIKINGLAVANCWTLTGNFLAIPAGCLFPVASGELFII